MGFENTPGYEDDNNSGEARVIEGPKPIFDQTKETGENMPDIDAAIRQQENQKRIEELRSELKSENDTVDRGNDPGLEALADTPNDPEDDIVRATESFTTFKPPKKKSLFRTILGWFSRMPEMGEVDKSETWEREVHVKKPSSPGPNGGKEEMESTQDIGETGGETARIEGISSTTNSEEEEDDTEEQAA